MVRTSLALLAGAAVAVIAAVALGEYGFDGWATIGSGVLTGVFVAEAALAVARRGSRLLAGACALLAGGSLAYAGWITLGHRLGTATPKGWAAIVLAAAAGGFRARPTGAARGSHPAPAATE